MLSTSGESTPLPIQAITHESTQLFPDASDLILEDPILDCMRIGVGTTIIDEQGRVLMLAHKKSDKCEEGALGPMTETVKWTEHDGIAVPESTLHTMARGVREELGIHNGGRNPLRFRASRTNGWFIDKVPVGDDYPGLSVLAICTVVHIPSQTAERLVENFEETNEIRSLSLMSREDIAAHDNFRSLARPILRKVFQRGMQHLPPTEQLQDVALPVQQVLTDSSDDIPRHLKLIR